MSVKAATARGAAGANLPPSTREALLEAEFDLTRSPSHFTPHSYEMNSKRVRSGSISGRLRSASDLEEKGIIDKFQLGSLKDRILSGDENTSTALDKLAEGDRSDLEALLISGALNQHTPLDLDMLVNGLVDEVDELDVSDFNGGATEQAARGGEDVNTYSQFEIEIGDLPFEGAFEDDGLLVGSLGEAAALLGNGVLGMSPSDAMGAAFPYVVIKGEDGADLNALSEKFWEESDRIRKMSISSTPQGERLLVIEGVSSTRSEGTVIKTEDGSTTTVTSTSHITSTASAVSTTSSAGLKTGSITIPRSQVTATISASSTTTTTTSSAAVGAAAGKPTMPAAYAGVPRPGLGKGYMVKPEFKEGGGAAIKKEGPLPPPLPNGSQPVTIGNRTVVIPRPCGHVGAYSPESRRRRIERFWDKKKNRIWQRKVKYDVRKNFADSRVRVKGRFVKKEDEAILLELNTLTNKEGFAELALPDLLDLDP